LVRTTENADDKVTPSEIDIATIHHVGGAGFYGDFVEHVDDMHLLVGIGESGTRHGGANPQVITWGQSLLDRL